MMSLTLEEFLTKRRKLEEGIRALLSQFETETGIMPKEVRLDLLRECAVGARRSRYRLADVRVGVDI